MWKKLKKIRAHMIKKLTVRYRRLLMNILWGKMGKKGSKRRHRYQYFAQIMKDMGSRTFREMKELSWELMGGWIFGQNTPRNLYLKMVIYLHQPYNSFSYKINNFATLKKQTLLIKIVLVVFR